MCAVALWITVLKSPLEIPHCFDLLLNKLKLMVLLELMYREESWLSNIFWLITAYSYQWASKKYSQFTRLVNVSVFFPSSGLLTGSFSLAHPCRITLRNFGPFLTLCSQGNWGRFLSLWSSSQCPSLWEVILMPLQCRWGRARKFYYNTNFLI